MAKNTQILNSLLRKSAIIIISLCFLLNLALDTGIASGEIVEKATRPSFSLFVGATPQNDDDDELYDDADVTEDDFAEFDIDDDEEPVIKKEATSQTKDDKQKAGGKSGQQSEEKKFGKEASESNIDVEEEEDEEDAEAMVEEEESEFSHFEDDEEFENYRQDEDEDDEFEHKPGKGARADRRRTTPPPPPPKTIKFASVPAHLRNNWENYYLEMLMIAGIVVYFINFFTGKSKNQRLANAWFTAHKTLLESNFALVGDDGSKDVDDIETHLQKESENIFTLWCSGRTCCEGMLVELRLLKRQDLVSVIGNAIKSGVQKDQVKIQVNMNAEDMDTFVFCLANKKTAARLAKEMADITTFCPERRAAIPDKHGISSNTASNYSIMSEIPEVTVAMLDSKLSAVLSKYPDAIDSIHFSDQYTGLKPTDSDQTPTELPQGKKVLIFTFNLDTTTKGILPEDTAENIKPMMMLVFYFIEKIKRFHLSREGKNKADKNRSKVSEAFWKSIHAAKAEKAQEERERKRRELKERIKEIDDPDKQRKMEAREERRDRKKAAPKMKQLKVKAM